MSFWGWLFHRKNREAELEEEVQAHLRMAAQERIEQGDVASDARTSAIREFGNVVLVKEVTREMWGLGWLETLLKTCATACGCWRRTLASPAPRSLCWLSAWA